MSKLATDIDGRPIQVMGYGAAHKFSYTATAGRNSAPFDSGTRVITVTTTTDGLFRLGGSGVTALTSDHLIKANIPYDMTVLGNKKDGSLYLSVIQLSAGGDCYISERV